MARFYIRKAQSVVELLLAMGLAAIILPALLTGLITAREGRPQQAQRLAASYLYREAAEAVRSVREKGWLSIPAPGVYHPEISGTSWSLQSGPETINGNYVRSVIVSDVYRDASGTISESGVILDSSTKRFTISVSWSDPRASLISSDYLLTRYRDNVALIDTTEADFNLGINNGTTVVNNDGGEVILGSGGQGNWCDPKQSIKAYYNLDGQAIATGITAIEGHAYTTTGGNASGHSMDSVLISNPPQPDPPVVTSGGFYDNHKNYGLFATASYIYLTSDHPFLTVDIVNSVNPFTSRGYFSGSSGGVGNSVYVTGDTGYVTAGNRLYAFDTSVILGSQSQPEKWKVSLAGTGGRLMVQGNFAYVTTNSTSSPLQRVNLTDRSVLNIPVGSNQVGVDIYVNPAGTQAYLATKNSDGSAGGYLHYIDLTANPPVVNPSPFSTGSMTPRAITAVPGNLVIVVGWGGDLYQVLRTGVSGTFTRCGGLAPGDLEEVTGINAVSAVLEADGDAYTYAVTNRSSAEFLVIQGGPGGQYVNTGTFVSRIFDVGLSTAFNRIQIDAFVPSLTALTTQVAVAAAVDGGCTSADYEFVGPDGSVSTSFNGAGIFPVPLSVNGGGYQNPGRCFRYRTTLSTADTNSTPVLNEVIVNYSP